MKNKRLCLTFFLMALVFIGGFMSCSDKKEDLKSSDFPIPYPEGGEIITNEWDGNTGHRTVKYKADQHSELIDFYDDYTSDSGWKRSDSEQGTIPSVIYLHLAKGYTIDIGPPDDQIKGATLITLYVAEWSNHLKRNI